MIDQAPKNLFGSSKVAEWIDENSKCDENTGRIHYQSVSIDGVIYRVKDYVFIDNADMPDNVDKAFIGRISDLFDNGDKLENKRAVIQWYWRRHELSKAMQKKVPSHNEILMNHYRVLDNDVDVETILSKCQVRELNSTNNVDNIDSDQFFVCRSYDMKEIKPLLPGSYLKPLSPRKRKRTSTEETVIKSPRKRPRVARILAERQLEQYYDSQTAADMAIKEAAKFDKVPPLKIRLSDLSVNICQDEVVKRTPCKRVRRRLVADERRCLSTGKKVARSDSLRTPVKGRRILEPDEDITPTRPIKMEEQIRELRKTPSRSVKKTKKGSDDEEDKDFAITPKIQKRISERNCLSTSKKTSFRRRIEKNDDKKVSSKVRKTLYKEDEDSDGWDSSPNSKIKTPGRRKRVDKELKAKRCSFGSLAETSPLPGRETEFDDLIAWIESHITSSSGGGCMYISGVPGTGKTATLERVIANLKADKDLPKFDLVHINALKLTEPHQTYVAIWEQLGGKKTTWKKAKSALDSRWNISNPRRFPTVLIVDELDVLCNRKQDVVYSLFDWPTWRFAKLVVVAVANAMDLPEQVLCARVSSRLGLTRTTFEPYNFRQLKTIVERNLKDVRNFDEEAIQLAARKVASLSGDARRVLHVCKYASSLANGQRVTLGDVERAFEDILSSPVVSAIRHLPLHQRYIMQAIISEMKRTGIDEVQSERVKSTYETLSRMDGVKIAGLDGLVKMISSLYSVGFIEMHPKSAPRYFMNTKIRLQISPDDVSYALASLQI
ncbi:DgyrCDS4819 [Dimorphilus gyrociliatus]|uniref:Origin recognition complex subunit 1 n=1 Tax=Dimorphilus gyrociliatus TaxID=2664684 RepID=A0A7I8VJI4_9ANNE|nr:DgyrCDS4819 [Dimorphilus gyrociliatus]